MYPIDVLLIYPPKRKASVNPASAARPPLGLAYLAAICKREGYTCDILDLNLRDSSNAKVKQYILEKNPKVFGISFVTEARFEAFDLFRLAKTILPGVATVGGGPHPSLCAEDCLKYVPEIDFIVRGEGEETLSELLGSLLSRRIHQNDIAGLSYRENGEIIHNRKRIPIKNLDILPFPALDVLRFEDYNFHIDVKEYEQRKAAPIVTSRGCPFSCNFCATTEVWGSTWRFRSTGNIFEEIEYLKKNYNIGAIWFDDDNFNSNTDRLNKICDEFICRKLDIKWVCNIRVDTMKEEDFVKMARAGCVKISFGAESGSQRVLDKIIKKRIKVEQIRNVDRWCYEHGILSDAQFIVSHPTETYEEASQTIDLMRDLKGKSILHFMKIYPATDIEKIAKQNGVIPENFSWALNNKKEDLLPSGFGDTPLFVDKLSVDQITRLMAIAWTEMGHYSLFHIIRKVIVKIRSPKELWNMMKHGIPILSYRLRKLIFNQY